MENLYATKLVSRSTSFIIPLGTLLILFGITSIILSSIDLSYSRSTVYYSSINNVITPLSVSSAHSEQSIWPTLGKGIWCGLFFIALGIFALISHREKTLISMRILSCLSFISIFISLFLFLSSILVFQRYIFEGRLNADQRTSMEQKELIINVLLFICGVLSLLVSLILAIGTLVCGQFCQPKIDDLEQIDSVYQPPPPPAYAAPHY
ncbi:unnamed protein product [Adineta steineri]|uniref:Uncharacterized protein n=1 Tax=Adineta steineri TaxID=433720 RepID=A0A815Y657_9BILA|nr:unnamed protein product [Adineta steineri]CAF1567297.1 unnamed protein product [Adineta steineri]